MTAPSPAVPGESEERRAAALDICDKVERNPVGWGGPTAVSLARTVRAALVGDPFDVVLTTEHDTPERDAELAAISTRQAATVLPQRLWAAIADVRDRAPRVPNDADSWAIVEAVLHVLNPEVSP